MTTLEIIGRNKELFFDDLGAYENELNYSTMQSSFLVLGGAGSIGMAVTKEIFKRNPRKLHVVDISENNLSELVRDIRSSYGYIKGEFKTFCLDIGSLEYDVFYNHQVRYDYVLNFSALKHVRSEKDPYTLMRMVNVNILNTNKTLSQSIDKGVNKYFCVSTDKAANPVSMMGASKRIMEYFLLDNSSSINISTARFANVAFSDGSLLHSFTQRLIKNQPIAAPSDIKRYFVTHDEAGLLCLMSCILGENMDIFFPKLESSKHLMSISEVAVKYLYSKGYEAVECCEEEARANVKKFKAHGKWPCVFQESDTTGEKPFEEFYMKGEKLDMDRFSNIGIIKGKGQMVSNRLHKFTAAIDAMKANNNWNKLELVELFEMMIPGFGHSETGKSLDDKM